MRLAAWLLCAALLVPTAADAQFIGDRDPCWVYAVAIKDAR